GMAEGAAHVVIEDAEADTLLSFTAVGGADGGIMKLGKALIGNSAQKVIDGFFARFGAAMGVEVTPLGGCTVVRRAPPAGAHLPIFDQMFKNSAVCLLPSAGLQDFILSNALGCQGGTSRAAAMREPGRRSH